MVPAPSNDALFAEAFDLAIALQDEPTPPRVAAVRAWRAQGPEYAAVWSRVAEIHGLAGHLLAERRRAERRTTRRRVLAGTALVLGAAGAWRIAGPELLRLRADATTGTGEMRTLTLPDGSAVVLGPETAVALDFGPERRGVTLLAGMGYFDVVADDALPFAVAAGGGPLAETTAAAFEVSEAEGALTVAVARGRLALADLGGPVPLVPGDVARRTRRKTTIARERPVERVADWRAGITVADNETVSALVDRIARWRDGPVIVAPGLGERRVSGVFALDAPDAALDAVVRPLGGRVRRIGPLAVLSG